ncbi:sensor histidine kinase [Streptomyces sp. NPDC018031]|uniref:sensor histidine kinase n=1 Tax=Streptomyces sp. NPDC018031 TaxID=3365033 RepID=UPI0037879B9A
MSFRLRALTLLMFIAITATAATAWLTLRQVTRQTRASVTAGQQEVSRITERLREYGLTHGTWDGVPATVARLAEDTGQRIRVTAVDGDVLLADSDALAGRAPREPGPQPPVVVDPRPRLLLPAGVQETSKAKIAVTALGEYRREALYAACLTRAGAEVTARTDPLGMPKVTAGSEAAAACKRPDWPARASRQDSHALEKCRTGRQVWTPGCVERVFNQRAGELGPPRLQVQLGALDETQPGPAAAPTVAVAAGVAAAVIAGALLLSRTVLRPVRALTGATRDLGGGDLERRVPVSGRDEIAALGRAFNRMAASLQESEERQRRLMSDIAHELRTPLANLRGYLEALRDGVLEPDRELLDSLHEETMLQQRIIDDLRDLALAEAGALTYHRTGVEVRELLEVCRTAHRPQARAAGVALDVRAPEPAWVHGDPDRLRQAIGNLVANAVRATAPGGTVTLVLVPHGELTIIQVSDTGTGIPAADLPHLFERFWRADAGPGRAAGGSGLGLPIARRIVTDHRGTIDVESTVGAGTTFTIVLTTLDAG